MDSVFSSVCYLGKIHKFPFPLPKTVYTKPLQLIHSDLWCPSPTTSSSGYRYYIHFIDAYSNSLGYIYWEISLILFKHLLVSTSSWTTIRLQD